jgi:hypothetical protein
MSVSRDVGREGRLLTEGRDKDLKAFIKHATKEGIYLVGRDNAVYNESFLPFMHACLEPSR